MDEVDGLFRNSLNKDWQMQQGCNSDKMQQGCNNMPGTFRTNLNNQKEIKRSNEVQTHKKTVRALCSMNDQLTTDIIDITAIVDTYLELYNRHHENETILIQWSVNSRYYQAKARKAIGQAVGKGYLERYGKSITISPKGEKVLRDYDRMFEELHERFKTDAEARKTVQQRRRRNYRREGEPTRATT